ncbi:heavy metal translocating P-type ATPase [Priestia megaterium]|uniref:heavy metal translocating P-type ATPase n=1 Tax=Priestia megaterium TaxID=1404 RepID=UPI0013E304DC|nr:heavy metal translocating P-type ATPase [Priestia megaterium]MED3863538.1 heavy metal translocating P-type ATPase [Priestia megaterium]MED4101406.1 heavy metal translocating P-type ATPase [Priestia megaterium]MED4145041.1 heavy metal translocating P-type ATPase [Priestia megaterium]MED4169983.1 heavy metal translocating P-type ATPase [Priestia megaterium]MED4199339.1 heavy metal translocating P-type ATPase [Priestia megaterium]
MKHEDKKNHQHTGNCCSGSSLPEIKSKTCCSSSSEAASTEEPSSCGTKSHEHSHSCCSDTIALTTDKGQHSCCSDQDIVPVDGDIEETAEYRVYGMDCSSCAATIEKSLKTLNDIQHVAINYNTGKLQVAAASESALSLIPNSVERLGFSIEPIQSNKKMKTYLIEGMDCAACANTIVNHLKTVPAVKDVRVNFSTGKAQIEHDNEADDIIKEVSKAGYTATLVTSSRQSAESRHHKGQNGPIVFSGILIALGFIGSHIGIASYMTTVLYAIAMIVSGYKPAKSAYYGIKSRSLDMNVLMTVAALGAAVIGEWLEGATVVWLFALGVALQTRSIEQTRNSIRGLMDLAPSEAWVKENGQLIKKAAEDISIGTTIVVKPGDRIPLDGEIINGESSISQAPITGESIPVDKVIGDAVYAGTINESGSLEIKVTKLVEDTTISKIIHLVEEAQEKKAPTQAFVDKFATIYTPIVFILALFIMVIPPLFDGAWSEWFYKGLELLVVACPCALVISTPVAIVSAIGNAAKNGVLIKGGTFLEKAGAINAIAFDKTGTLTEGKPAVSEVVSLAAEENQLLAITKTLEDYSNHPIARAIVDYAAEKKVASLQGSNFKILTGKGVQATIQETVYYAGNAKLFSDLGTPLSNCWSHIEKLQNEGKTIIIVGTAKSVLGIISVADTIRHTTVSALESLKQNGMQQIVMLTGDNEGTAKMIASQSRVDRYFAGLLPEDKVKAIQQLQHEGYQTAMVGDGINDAPALATADLGIAMGGAGTDTAMETADIVLMADNLEKLPHTMKLSRKALAVIKQNIWFSIIVKVIALAFIFPGWLTLWIAVLSDTGAALLVILNSLRLLKMKK